MSDRLCVSCNIVAPYSKLAIYCKRCLLTKNAIIAKVDSCNQRAKKMGIEGRFTVDEWKSLCDK